MRTAVIWSWSEDPGSSGKNIMTKVMLNLYFISSDDMFIEARTYVVFPDAVCTYQNSFIAFYDAFPSETIRPFST